MRGKLGGWFAHAAQAAQINDSLYPMRLGGLCTLTRGGQVLLFEILTASHAVDQVIHRIHAFHGCRPRLGPQHITLETLDSWPPQLMLKMGWPAHQTANTIPCLK